MAASKADECQLPPGPCHTETEGAPGVQDTACQNTVEPWQKIMTNVS